MELKKSDFYYDLPERLIAQTPAEPRDSARMLVYDRGTGETAHRHFYDLPDYLKRGDILVINNTRVLPARIYGHKATGARVELLLHKRRSLTEWEVLARPARKAEPGTELIFSDRLRAVVTGRGEDGLRTVRFSFEGVFEDLLAQVGEMPLPPYIRRKPAETDAERYQTVYAKESGSSAAPTAGLHFTSGLMERVRAAGAEFVEVLLHVGLGTFRPVKTENVLDHKMHSEFYAVSPEAAGKLNDAKKQGRRIIAVGTTSVRVLESATDDTGEIRAGSGDTDIFIYPPYTFRSVDGLITNFHLPESTLVMLVSAFIGREKTLALYKEAVEKEYRFFSYGDACLLL